MGLVLNPSLVAYTAGLVDGEGSIQINPSHPTAGGPGYWSLTVQVTSVSDGVLEQLQTEWGLGSITYWHSRGTRQRRVANWRLYSAEAETFLAALLPFLRMKKARAKIALEFRRYVSRTGGRLSAEWREKRTELALALRSLNATTGKGRGAASWAS